ncbi:MAG: hypothetical protein L0210_00825 [Rhodospirillales bacterium]|nr:hypothetical protein [Rhodospirillales bacterium]
MRSLQKIAYKPREHQKSLHKSLKRFGVLVAHRRFGKTVFAIGHLIRKACENRLAAPRYAYIAPFYRQAKVVAWDYLKRITAGLPEVRHHETELRCDFFGDRRITLYGSDDPDSLRGLYLDGVVLDEYAQMDPRVWSEVIRPALADRKGWALFIGTPMGRNAFFELYEHAKADPTWFAALYKASETRIIDAEELAAARTAMTADEYAQEFECSFTAAIAGAYYGALLNDAETAGRIGRVPWEPALQVHTAWDLGVGDATAIWFCQLHGREVRIIDYYESSGVGLDHYVRQLRQKPYVYGQHILPHDARVQEMGSGKTRVETLQSLGVWPRVLENGSLEDGINEVRKLLPRCWFDAANCARGLEALRHYRTEWDERRRTFGGKPLHDWSSHAADAFRYLAVGQPREDRPLPPIKYDDRGIV